MKFPSYADLAVIRSAMETVRQLRPQLEELAASIELQRPHFESMNRLVAQTASELAVNYRSAAQLAGSYRPAAEVALAHHRSTLDAIASLLTNKDIQELLSHRSRWMEQWTANRDLARHAQEVATFMRPAALAWQVQAIAGLGADVIEEWKARGAHDAPRVDQAALQQQLDDARGALARLTAAVVAGGDVPALVDAIKVQDARRIALEERIAVLARPALAFDATLERSLSAAVGEWRDVLGRQVVQARQVVLKLVSGRVTFFPEARDDQQGFRFTATGTVEKLIDGLVPGHFLSLQAVASPPGFEPGSWP